MSTIKVKQVRSTISCPATQGKTVRALGLKRINDVVELPDNACTRGMIFKVKHLVKVVEE